MAITVSRLDGQTLGFALTAPNSTADVLSLDIVSGALTSAYLSDLELLNLKPAVDALFSLVPSAQRAAGALGMLQRLVTVAPAAAASLSQAAVNTAGTVYALRVTTSAQPTQFIVHLPFSADGQLAWATGIDVVGTGTVTSVTASSPLASSGGATPNITITSPLPTLNGGTGVNGSASNGVFSVSAGVGGVTPLVFATASVGVEAADTIPTTIQLKNGSGNYTAVMGFWGQVTQGTLAGLTLSAGASGQVLPMADFATSGRFALLSSAAGTVILNVNTAAAETVQIFYGPGPGTDQLFLGGNFQMTFA